MRYSDVDWFWRGWFYGTDPCDISLDTVKHAKPDLDVVGQETKESTIMQSIAPPISPAYDDIARIRNRDLGIKFAVDADTSLQDFYYRYDRGLEKYDTTKFPVTTPAFKPEGLTAEEKEKYGNKNMYELTFSNKGGLVMPIILEWTYKDGTKEVEKIPAQVWRGNENKVVKTFIKDKEVASVRLDPYRETADINESNNTWNTIAPPSKFSIFKARQGGGPRSGAGQANNPMQKAAEKKAF